MDPATKVAKARDFTGGAFGAGLVLVFLPGAALVFGARWLGAEPVLGLPILAIFGIMILFGSLALISTLFARLGLDAKTEALALPPGSVRAAITLALIVLFALISVMLYQALAQTYEIKDLSTAEKAELVKDSSNQVVAVIPRPCRPVPAEDAASAGATSAASSPPGAASVPSRSDRTASGNCAPGDKFAYTVRLHQLPTPGSTDLAKQLLTLIGTLMTSVVSFYFAAKSAEATTKTAIAAVVATTGQTAKTGAPDTTTGIGRGTEAGTGAGNQAGTAAEDQIDGCDAPIENATPDDELPPANGGVAS